MKYCVVFLFLLLLTGCGSKQKEMDRVLELRQSILNGNGCSFHAEVAADYGDNLYSFGLQCQVDTIGNVSFSVTAPDTISGITGKISTGEGKRTFDNEVLLFDLMADGQLTPVSGPWHFIKALRSGYISACGKDSEGFLVLIDDSYEDEMMTLEIWTDENYIPIRCEILYDGKRILSMNVGKFQIL